MAVACGDGHTVMVGELGFEVFACGRGGSGQLGVGTREDQRAPALVAGLAEVLGNARVVMVAAGEYHSAASTSEGELLAWGCGEFGRLGYSTGEDGTVPVKLGRELFGGLRVIMVSCGGHHTMAVTNAGSVFTFGEGPHGQLGHGDRNHRSFPTEIPATRFGQAQVIFVAAGYIHSGVVTSKGGVWTWGCGARARLGLCDERDQVAPRELLTEFGGSKVVMMSAGGAHTMFITEEGGLWGCGYGGYGQLGLGDCANRAEPVRVGMGGNFKQYKVLTVACGIAHTLAVTEKGKLWSWGRGYRGRLGHEAQFERNRLVPEVVDLARYGGGPVMAVCCGHNHSAAVTIDGALYTWGQGATYPGSQIPAGLGHEDLDDKIVPTLVAPQLLGTRIGRCLSLSPLHALAFAMGTHSRLGAGAAGAGGMGKVRSLGRVQGCAFVGLPAEIVRKIVDLCRGWPEGCAGEVEGVVRLVGGGMLLNRMKTRRGEEDM